MPKRDSNGNWVPTDEDIRRAERVRQDPNRYNRQQPTPKATQEEINEARRLLRSLDARKK